MNIDHHEKWFNSYVNGKIRESGRETGPLLLKLRHTRNVLANSRDIAAAEGLTGMMKAASELAALYHDLGRFEQYLRFGTFKDRDSCNHGILGVRLLKKHQRLAGETIMLKRLVLTAVALHNCLALPVAIPQAFRVICQIIRDADKIDIARVMDEHLSGPGPYNPTIVLGLPDDPELYSPKVIEKALQGQSPAYDELRSVNDFRVLLGSWYYQLGSGKSRELLARQGHAASLVERLPARGAYAKAREQLLRNLA